MEMNVVNCQRCGCPTNGRTIMSYFNRQVICMACKADERQDPDYDRAVEADCAACRAGNYNFPGIGLPARLQTLAIARSAFNRYGDTMQKLAEN